MELGELKERLQNHFTDGLLTVVGSGLSVGEGVPGMKPLANHLLSRVPDEIEEDSRLAWDQIRADLEKGTDLETALLKTMPGGSLETVLLRITAEFIETAEEPIIREVATGGRTLRFSRLLEHMLKPNSGIPVVTTNYDRLIEVAAEAAGVGVDSLFVGSYLGRFDRKESRASLCRGVTQRRKIVHLAYAPHIVLLKPHGSLDWFLSKGCPVRSLLVRGGPPLIITPGVNKFRGGYERPFDAHRERANSEIDQAARYLIIGYGFNDDHLQVHLEHQLRSGKPALLLCRTLSVKARKLAEECKGIWAICSDGAAGARVIAGDEEVHIPERALWDLDVFISEVLEP